MPKIYLQMHDGVRLALPEGAAQFSGVLRRALESWAESYGPPPASATDDGCARACSDPERTPDRLGDEEEEEDRLSGIKSLNLSSINERKTRTPSLKQVLDSKGNGSVRDVDGFEGVVVGSSEDTDGTVSVLDDDESDSPSRGDAIQTSSYGLFNRSKEGDQGQGGHSVRKGRNGVNVSQRESCAVGSTGGAVLNPEPRQAGSLRNEPDEAEREYLDSATPSTLDNDDYDEEMNEDDEGEYVGREISQQKPVRGGGKETSSQLNTAAAPVCMSTFSPVAENGVQGSDDKRVETRPYPTPFPSPSALSREDYTHRVCSGQSQTIASEQHTDTTAVGPSVSLVTLVAETITAKSPSRDELEGRQMLATESRSGTTSLTPCNQTNEGVTSPSNYHQRTPCMIGDEDDVLFLSGSCISFSNEDFNPAAALSLQQLSSASKEFVSPVNNSNSNSNRAAIEPLTPPQQQLNNLGFDGSSHSNHRQPDTGDNVKANVSGPPEICPLQQCAYITEREIIIELQNSLSLTEPSSARRSHDDESTKSLNTFSSSKAMTQVPPTSSARMSQSFKSATRGTLLTSNNTDSDTKVFGGSAEYLKLAPATSSIVVDMHERHSAQPVSALSPGKRTEPLAQSPTLDAAALCATYLCHFSGNQQDHQGTFHPTITPEPLSAPLVALLTSWERNFLYCDVLGYTPEQLSSAMAIVQEAPKMNYLNPAPFLRNPTVTKALLVDSPTAERMSLLMRIIKMSEALQIPTLYNLCVAWCADFVTRTCYGAGDHFTAAALVRECFHVENDWSRKEMDCLKLENEWPVDEED
ncbi:hypothetical protein TRVL_00478 [Trypanosoma vivax]|nr:hypothetical protein TRVL_00478 [Trypanosoma vivax]